MVSLEYFLGSFITAAAIFLMYRANLGKYMNKYKIRYSQSYILETTKPFLKPTKYFKVARQSDKHNERVNINVIIMEDRAFWIKNNAVYTADVENNEIVKSSAVQVDMMAMDAVELDKMMFIVDQLTERQKNDRGNTGI